MQYLEYSIDTQRLQRWMDSGIVLAVSGGADSVAMLRLFAQLRDCGPGNPELVVAHLNHGLRGTESEQDAEFVRSLSGDFGLPFFQRRLDRGDWDRDETGSFEAAARDLRYEFLLETAENLGFRHVATAHSRDDRIETVLHRILRGTGIRGLAGIPEIRKLSEAVSLVRPMLDLSRAEILAYLQRRNQVFRTDSSNSSSQWTRNRIRNDLLPKLKSEYNPALEEALEHLSRIAKDFSVLLDRQVETILEKAVLFRCGSEVKLDVRELDKHSDLLIREFFHALWKEQDWSLRRIGFEQWTRLEKIVRQSTTDKSRIRDIFPGELQIDFDPRSKTLTLKTKEPG